MREREQGIVLESPSLGGGRYKAHFSPEKGMNLLSFQRDGVEVIDPDTYPLFEKRLAGLGALIGPHFHRRKKEILPKLPSGLPLPHVYETENDPFSHGIARYASWKFEQKENGIYAQLKGDDLLGSVPLKNLEGQDFTMNFSAILSPHGLSLELSIVSQTDSLVGLHYYYKLPNRKGALQFQGKKEILRNGEKVSAPSHWLNPDKAFMIPLEGEELDYTFHSFPDPCRSCVELKTEEFSLSIESVFPCQENCIQVYHPPNSSFVCIEPIASQVPQKPNLTVSRLRCLLSIELPKGR